MAKISKRLVDGATPRAKRYFIWDSDVHGFGLVVQPSGAKSYCYQYRTRESITRRVVLGRHGTLTPELARSKALECRRQVEQGESPGELKRARRGALRVSGLLDSYLYSAKFLEKAASTRAIDKGRINRHLKPIFGNRIADQLTSEDVRKGFRAIASGKTAGDIKTGPRGLARVRGGEGAARACIRLLKAVYSWAVSEKILKENPASGVSVGKDGERTAVIETTEQYAEIFEVIDRLERFRKIHSPAADGVRVVMLTGARSGEIARLRNRQVDLKKGIATLSKREHKTGKKTEAVKIIELPASAQAIIARQPEGGPDDLVFRSPSGDTPINLSKVWNLVRQEAGLGKAVVLHSFRHSLATSMAANGYGAPEIMSVLGHKDIRTSQRYIHLIEQQRKRLAERATSGITAALTGKKAGEVVRMKKPKTKRKE